MEREIGVVCFEDGGRGHKPKEYRLALEAEKCKETDFPFRASRRNQPCIHLVLSQMKWILDF